MNLDNTNNPVNTNSILQSEKAVDVHAIIENILSGMVFLLPIFFLPFTSDVFSLNKTYLVMLVSALSLILFFVDALRRKKLQIRSISTYLPFFLILLGALVSTYFSTNRRISLFGYYGNYEYSFIYLLSLAFIGFVVSNIKVSMSKIVNFFFSGVTLSVLISLTSFYFKFIPGLGQTGNSFSLVGNNNLLVGLETIVILGSFYKLGNLSLKNIKASLLFGFFISICAIHLLIIGNVLSLAFVVVVMFYLFVSSKVDFAKTRNIFLPIAVMVIFVTFINYFSVTREVFNIQPFQASLRLPLTESWLVSIQSVRDFPFTGTGLGTFVTDFTRYRPASLNIGATWAARFSFPYNDIFLWLATAGLVGLTLYVLFWVLVIRDGFSLVREGKDKYFVSFIILMTFISLMFFGSSVSLYAFLFIMVGIVMNNKNSTFITTHSVNSIGVFVLLALSVSGVLGYQAYKVYLGQVNFMNSLLTNDISIRYELQNAAIQADPSESVYIRSFIDTSLYIARVISQNEKPTSTDTTQVQSLVSQSVEYARILTEVINPLDVANWEMRGQVYDALSGVADNADQFAASAYTNAINLESTNPSLWLRLGSVYYRQKSYANAVQAFSRSVQLKNDFANAHYNLAFALNDAGDPVSALTQLEIVQRLIPVDSADSKILGEQIDAMRKLAEDAIAQAQAANANAESEATSSVPQPQNQQPVNVEQPLSNPNEQTSTQIEPNVDIPAEVIEPKADGSNGTEAPLANPSEDN